jgi:hypothetical protein
MLTRVVLRKGFTVNFIGVMFYTWYGQNHMLKYILDKNFMFC